MLRLLSRPEPQVLSTYLLQIDMADQNAKPEDVPPPSQSAQPAQQPHSYHHSHNENGKDKSEQTTNVPATPTPGTLVDEKGHNLIYSPEELMLTNVKTHGFAGRIVQKMGVWAYALFFVVPLAYVAIFFAIIPLGNPKIHTFREQWVFVLISNVCVMIAIAYLYTAAFLSLADCDRPFRTSLVPLIAVTVGQLCVMTPILLTHGVFRYIGIIALATCYVSLFFSMYFTYYDLRDKLHSFFRRFMVLLILFLPLLSAFVIAYRETESSLVQAALSFGFALVTFVYRRIMLSRLDPFPLESSQLYAGFWVQNLGDCTTILALPQVRSPKVFVAVFFSNSISNVAFLIFVSDLWIYRIRPILKTYVKNAIKCNFPLPPIPEPDETFDPHNRGHDYNVGGYRRRQFRFFFFRLLSQSVAMFFYLSISPMLRFGINQDYTPLAEVLLDGDESTALLKNHEYRNSMIYAAINLGFILVVAILGYTYLNKKHHQTFHEIREIHRHDFIHHAMVGEITAIITHNMIMTIAIILSHYCIFASFNKCVLERA